MLPIGYNESSNPLPLEVLQFPSMINPELTLGAILMKDQHVKVSCWSFTWAFWLMLAQTFNQLKTLILNTTHIFIDSLKTP
jgi:hypothetical protein